MLKTEIGLLPNTTTELLVARWIIMLNKEEMIKLREKVTELFLTANLDIKSCPQINETISLNENLKLIGEYIANIKVKEIWEQELQKIINTKSSETLERLYFIPNQYIEMVITGRRNGLFLYGDGGWGKSYNVKRKLALHKLEEGKDYVFICGHITPAQFYMNLYYARDKIVVFDDVNILESKTNLNMLKACLNENSHNRVEYHTTSKFMEKNNIPSSFFFNGRVIILLNEQLKKNNNNLNAVETRILHHHLQFNYKDKISILFDIAKLDYEGISLEDRIIVANWIKQNTSEATENLSIRLLFMCFEFFKFNRSRWIDLAKNYVRNDEYTTLLIQGCEKDWCETTGKSRESYFRARRKLKGGISV
jgi:hypothetical protein